MRKIRYSCIGIVTMLMMSGCSNIRADKDYIGLLEDIETTKEFEERIVEETCEIDEREYAILKEQEEKHNEIMYSLNGCKLCRDKEVGETEVKCMSINLKENKYDGDRGIGYCRVKGLYRYERKDKEERVSKDDEYEYYDYYNGGKIK